MGYHDHVDKKIKNALASLMPELDKRLKRALKDPRMSDERTPKADSVTQGRIHPDYRSGANDLHCARRQDGVGNANNNSAAYTHTHSSHPFVRRPRAWRLATIAVRRRIRAWRRPGGGPAREAWEELLGVVEDLRDATDRSLSLQMDYLHMTAEEREEMLDSGTDEAKVYKFRYRIDDWRELDEKEMEDLMKELRGRSPKAFPDEYEPEGGQEEEEGRGA